MITVKINNVSINSVVIWNSLSVEQNLTSQVDAASFRLRKYGDRTVTPGIGDAVSIYDGDDKVFGGQITNVNEEVESNAEGLIYSVSCVDHTYELDGTLVAESYEDMTVREIIEDLISKYATDFSADGVDSDFEISSIVFNQIPFSQCIKRMADLLKYEWYIDPDKTIYFFSKFSIYAPFNLQDTSGNYIYKSLKRKVDGTQIANQVKVRGGLATESSIYEDAITVVGNETMSFPLTFKFKDLQIAVNGTSKVVGAMYLDKFIADGGTAEVLYDYQNDSINFPSVLSDADEITFSGYRKYPVMAVATDDESVAVYGLREKLIKDTSIIDDTIARKRAQAELQVYKEEISDGSFDTYTKGLRAGMLIQLDSELRDVTTDFLIKKLKMIPKDPKTFMYQITIVTTRKYSLTELLQKLMQVEDEKIDENEVAQMLKVDIVTLSVDEVIDVVSSVTDIAELEIVEDINKDPIGDGVEPIWVLASYFPTGPEDEKREGRLDLSFTLY